MIMSTSSLCTPAYSGPSSGGDLEHSSSISLTETRTKRSLGQRAAHSITSAWLRFSDWSIEWTPFILVACYWPTVTAIFVMCSSQAIEVLYYFYMIVNLYIAAVSAFESFLALTPVRLARKAAIEFIQTEVNLRKDAGDGLPFMDMVIVAYLPNEKDIVEQQIMHALEELQYPSYKLRINLVYNTPKPIEPLESRLRDLERDCDQLRVIKVPESTSKADNLNYFLSLPHSGHAEYIGIFDTDHLPHPHNPRWAAERFKKDKPDIVQGRCVVYNTNESFLAKMIAIEFDKIYAIAHPGRSRLCGFGLFCGSNGWWRADVLRDIRMRESMLTEDIDSALRAYGKGYHAVHDLNVVSYELAPTSLRAFWKQRMRWTQGWTQASINHLPLLWTNPPRPKPKRTFPERNGLFSLLFVRELSYYFVSQHSCLILSFIVNNWPHSAGGLVKLIWFQYPLAEWFFILVILALITTIYCTNIVRSEFTSWWHMFAFTIVYVPYLVIQSCMGIFGHARELTKYTKWNPTERK